MYNIIKADVDPVRFLEDIIKSKKSPNKARMQRLKDRICQCYEDYRSKAEIDALNELNPQWEYDEANKSTDGAFLYSQYDNSKTSINSLRNKIIEANGGCVLLKCPICEVGFAKELDHYIPRALYPEYSVFPHNLIPICHECNNKKGELWCGDNHERLIFNAYYDTVATDELYEIRFDFNKGLPFIHLSIRQFGDSTNRRTKLALSTIDLLGFMPLQECELNKMLARELEELLMRCRKGRSSIDEILATEEEVYQEMLNLQTDVNSLKYLMYSSMLRCKQLFEWVRMESKKLFVSVQN